MSRVALMEPEPVKGDEWFTEPRCSCPPPLVARASRGGSEEHSVLSGVLGSRWAGRPVGIDAAWMARALRTGRLDKRQKQAVRELAQCMDVGEDQPHELLAVMGDEALTVRQVANVFRQAGVTNPTLTGWINARGSPPRVIVQGTERARSYAEVVLRGESGRRYVTWREWTVRERAALAEELCRGLGGSATGETGSILGALCRDRSPEVRGKAQAWCQDLMLPDESYDTMLDKETQASRIGTYWSTWWRGYKDAKTAGAPRRGVSVARALGECLSVCREEETWKEMMEELRSIAEEQSPVGAHARQVMRQHTKGGEVPQEHMAPVRQKIQHWVPKSVQEAWTQGGRGRKLLLEDGRMVPYTPSRNWRERHFCTDATLEGEESLEDLLGVVEGAWSKIRRYIAEEHKAPPKGHNDYEWMVLSAVVQIMRTEQGGAPGGIRKVQEEMIRYVGQTLEGRGEQSEIPPNLSFFDDSIRIGIEERQSRQRAIVAAGAAANTAYDLDAGILYSRTGRILLPDSGGWRQNPWADPWEIPWGWASIGACICIPVSPYVCLVLYDGWTYDWGGKDSDRQCKTLTKEEERRLGHLAAMAAGSEIACKPEAEVEEWMVRESRNRWMRRIPAEKEWNGIPGIKTAPNMEEFLSKATRTSGVKLYGLPARPSSTGSWE